MPCYTVEKRTYTKKKYSPMVKRKARKEYKSYKKDVDDISKYKKKPILTYKGRTLIK